jgi:iron-sulfur cluster assembly protein
MITISDNARDKVLEHLANRGEGLGLRLGVKTTGCSGLAYTIEYADSTDPTDNVFEGNNVKIFVDAKSIEYLEGTHVDYVRRGLNEGFEFSNPNQTGACGCGESFQV